jgi:predicted hydrocarbon binding protein
MRITNKTNFDPVTEIPQVEAYMYYALTTMEKMIGTENLQEILHENKMQRLIKDYPSDSYKLSNNIKLGDYANLCTSLMEFYSPNGQSKSIEFGRISTKPILERQGALFNFTSRMAIKLLPTSSQVKTVLDSIKNDLKKIYKNTKVDIGIEIEDRGNKWAYIDKSCAVCAGKKSDSPICWSWVGTLEESLFWLTEKEFEINQTECRAMGAEFCIWEIMKSPK